METNLVNSSPFLTPSTNPAVLSILYNFFFFFCLKSIKVLCSHHFFRSSFSWEGSHVRAKMHSLVNLSSSSLIIRPGQKPKEGRGEFFLPTGHTNYCHLWPEQNKCHQDSQRPTSFPLLKSVLSFITYVYIHKQHSSVSPIFEPLKWCYAQFIVLIFSFTKYYICEIHNFWHVWNMLTFPQCMVFH